LLNAKNRVRHHQTVRSCSMGIAMIAVFVVVSGCSTYRQSRTTAAIGGLMLGASIVATGVAVSLDEGCEAPPCFGPSMAVMTSLTAVGVSFWVGVAGLIGMNAHSDQSEARSSDRALELEQCRKERARREREADAIIDLEERARAFQALPTCDDA
jgi:hypothetical protein